MIHAKLPCAYANFFSDAQLEDENPNLHPIRRAVLSYVCLPRQSTPSFISSRITAEEDAFGDDEASDGEDSDDYEFWDCERRTKHPSLRRGSQAKSVDRFAILACIDVNQHRIRSSTLKDETTSDENRDDTSDYSESNLSAYTALEEESASSLVTSQDAGTEATSVHDLSLDIKCVAADSLGGELKSITLSGNEDAGISSDDDNLFAQYGALLPSDKMPEKYKRCHLKLKKRVSLPFNTQSSIPRSCYRVVDFLHTNNFSEVVVAQSMAEDDKKGSGGKLCCIKIYRHGWLLPNPEDSRPELQAETKAYQRLSEAVQSKRPGFQFLMQLQALLHDESRTFFIMVRLLRSAIDSSSESCNRK